MFPLSLSHLLPLAGAIALASHALAADPAPKPATPAAAPAATQSAWRPLFDGKTLEGWKVTDFAGRGEVTVEEESIVLDTGNNITGITYPGELAKMNYEVELEAKRISGGDFFCALTFPVAAAHCTFVVGGWGGAQVGISNVDGQNASENSTGQSMKFDPNRWYKIRVRVTPAKLEAWIDDAQMVNLELEDRTLSVRPGEIELSKPFGIASYQTRAALRGIKIRSL